MLFQFYGDKEIDVLKNHFFQSDLQDQEKLLCEWRSFKFELIELIGRNGFISKTRLSQINWSWSTYTATEWVLCQVLGQLQEEFIHLVAISKTALVAPVSNAWPECGGSTIKCIKARSRSQMKNDMLEALMMISMVQLQIVNWLTNSSGKLLCILSQAADTNDPQQLKYFQQNHHLLCMFKRMTSCGLKV